MKLLKLVPDNTNIDFMRWRNLALVLSILVTVASLDSRWHQGPQPRRRLRRRPDDPGHLRAAGRRRAASQQRRLAQHRRRQHPGDRRAAELPDPPAQAGGRRSGRKPRGLAGPRDARSSDIRARAWIRSRPCRARSARSWPGTAAWRSASRCSESPSTSGSGSNGSSASGRWSPCSTTCR